MYPGPNRYFGDVIENFIVKLSIASKLEAEGNGRKISRARSG